MIKTKASAGPTIVVYSRFNTCAMGFASGILWGVFLFAMGIIAAHYNWGQDLVKAFGSFYIGYDIGTNGAIIGLLWGFLCGFINGFIFAGLYNLCLGCPKCNCSFCQCKE